MPGCAVANCKNYSRKTRNSDIKYYSFPKEKEMHSKWTFACRRQDKISNKYARICSVHFKESCFEVPLKQQLLQYTYKRYRNLKADAIPTENLPLSKPEKGTEERCLRRIKRLRKSILFNVSQENNKDEPLNTLNEEITPQSEEVNCSFQDLSRRADRIPSSDSRLCSCHFKDGKKENDPTVLNYTKTEAFNFPSPEKKRKKRLQKSDEPVSTSSPSLQSNAILMCENSDLEKRVEELQAQVKQNRLYFKFDYIRKNDDLVLMYTGLPNAKVFDMLLNYVKRFDFKYYYDCNVTDLTLEDQLFITLQKLRQNYTFDDLAVRYSVSDTTVQNCFHTFVHILHESLFHFILSDKNELLSLQTIQQSSPVVEDFPNCRFLVDCTDIYIETPQSNMEAQRQTLSHYKNRQTFKALLAVTPRGIICFSSDLYPGSSSDKYIFHESGFSDLLNPGDLIIADKDFFDWDQLPKGVSLNIPPFLMQAQFTTEREKYTTQIAHSRINVERAIQRIKSFDILDNISHNFKSFATKIFQVCVTLVNFQTPMTDNKDDFTKHLGTPD